MIEGPIPLIAGNWKMNGLRSSLDEIRSIAQAALQSTAVQRDRIEVLVCPPATLLMAAAEICGNISVHLGGQNCHSEISGAHTGDISAEMLADAGASYVILGHSEQRADHGETDEAVRSKSLAAVRAGLVPIICVGETRAEREEDRALAIVGRQLKGSVPADLAATSFVVAYEPIWAIGTGITPSETDIIEMHAFIRRELGNVIGQGDGVKILYGGSVKPGNAAELAKLENVNGVLVGGASLKSADFLQIIKAFS